MPSTLSAAIAVGWPSKARRQGKGIVGRGSSWPHDLCHADEADDKRSANKENIPENNFYIFDFLLHLLGVAFGLSTLTIFFCFFRFWSSSLCSWPEFYLSINKLLLRRNWNAAKAARVTATFLGKSLIAPREREEGDRKRGQCCVVVRLPVPVWAQMNRSTALGRPA